MIRHVLKDGTEVSSIEGHVIKYSEHSTLYELINRMQEEGEHRKDETV